MRSNFDVSNVVRAFLRRMFDEQPELIKEFTQAVAHERRITGELLPMMAVEVHKNSASPVQCLQIGLIQGMALGVLLERDRQARMKLVQ